MWPRYYIWLIVIPLGLVLFRSFPFHFSQTVSQSLTGLWIERGSSCCWIHPPPPLQLCCHAFQAFWTSPESETFKHRCQGLKCTQIDIANPPFCCWIFQCYMNDELTKVDSCRLLFFRCFLCFFPSLSPSSFLPCPFCGTACHQNIG